MSLPESPASASPELSPAPTPRPRRPLIVGCVVFGWIGSVWVGSSWLQTSLLEHASRDALATLFLVDAWVAAQEKPAESENVDEPGAGAELGAMSSPELAVEGATPKRARTLDTIVVEGPRVLEWIRRGKIPRGRALPANPWLPAGLSIGGVSRFGLGLTESDRLVRVEGQSVTDTSAVVSAVLAAFGRGAAQISGEFVRATGNGPRIIRLVVHLPTAQEVQAVLERN